MKPNLLARSVLAACLSLNICVQSVSSAFALDAEGPIDGQNNGDGYDPNPTQGGPRYTGKHLAAPNTFKCTHNSFWLYGFMQWNDRDENGFPHYRQWIQQSELKPPPLKNDSHTYFLGINTGDHVRNYRYMKSQQNMGPIGPEDIVKSTIARFDSIGLETRAGGLVWAPGGNNHLQGLTR